MTDLPTTEPTALPAGFPGEDALCEQCGYPLKGLAPEGACPECGSPIAESHPDHRTGTTFEHRSGPIGYLRTAAAIIRYPKRTFRAMRIVRPNHLPRVFLWTNASIAALLWATAISLRLLHNFDEINPLVPAFGAVIVFFVVNLLTYIEVLGVAWFTRRRGWRVPLRSAERVACYASVGWVPGAVVLGLLMNLARNNILQDNWVWLGGNPAYAADAVWALLFVVGVAGMLGFETLVWVGVRQVKFANTALPATPPLQ